VVRCPVLKSLYYKSVMPHVWSQYFCSFSGSSFMPCLFRLPLLAFALPACCRPQFPPGGWTDPELTPSTLFHLVAQLMEKGGQRVRAGPFQ